MTSPPIDFPKLLVSSNDIGLIYVAIGCAGNALQEYPPFLKELCGNKQTVCFLIDPELENPLLAQVRDVIFIRIPQSFYWTLHRTDLEKLVGFVGINVRIVVQDYTGVDINPYYPHHLYRGGSVLYDFTYGNGGCTVDFSKVNILRGQSGTFIQHRGKTLIGTFSKEVAHEDS